MDMFRNSFENEAASLLYPQDKTFSHFLVHGKVLYVTGLLIFTVLHKAKDAISTFNLDCTSSPKGIVRFWSCNKAVTNVFPHKAEPSSAFRTGQYLLDC